MLEHFFTQQPTSQPPTITWQWPPCQRTPMDIATRSPHHLPPQPTPAHRHPAPTKKSNKRRRSRTNTQFPRHVLQYFRYPYIALCYIYRNPFFISNNWIKFYIITSKRIHIKSYHASKYPCTDLITKKNTNNQTKKDITHKLLPMNRTCLYYSYSELDAS